MTKFSTGVAGRARRMVAGTAIVFTGFLTVQAQAADLAITGATGHLHDDSVNGRRIEVYMDIANDGAADWLFAVRSRLSRMTMLSVPEHEDGGAHGGAHDAAAGMSEHLRTSVLEIPAGGVTRLRMGGAHIMLMEPATVPNAGRTFPVTLFFERAGRIEVDVVLEPPEMSQGANGHDPGH